MFIRFVRIHERDGQTDGHTDGHRQTPHVSRDRAYRAAKTIEIDSNRKHAISY